MLQIDPLTDSAITCIGRHETQIDARTRQGQAVLFLEMESLGLFGALLYRCIGRTDGKTEHGLFVIAFGRDQLAVLKAGHLATDNHRWPEGAEIAKGKFG